jgi:hypothetical protein
MDVVGAPIRTMIEDNKFLRSMMSMETVKFWGRIIVMLLGPLVGSRCLMTIVFKKHDFNGYPKISHIENIERICG